MIINWLPELNRREGLCAGATCGFGLFVMTSHLQ